ncbi:acetamidase/formamidase [Motilibacter rhizosphaerae]|uniref:Acetamidase/formamidase n=1 Tax=Motilibacter rhizosphaerae TaxID=598652 RepID=A0A4Q7NTB3_9ACTN|nr:acetamidase/formamidase family protein [Motilibacter rhizosphaerae]RZS90038.1 acetamidase/formamidase [Motilibacter rhizosphaerae]
MLRWEPDPGADPADLVYTFGGVGPVATLRPGELLSTWSLDCFGGRVTEVGHLASERCDPRFLNPQSGPFHIEGAAPGDAVAVHFVSITPRYGRGVSTTVPFFGALTSTPRTASLQPALPERTWVYELDVPAGVVRYDALDSRFTVDLPLDPMHGTVGVAPPLGEVRSSLTPGSWGGNMDTPEMRAGTTCYLRANVPGALLSLGDGHARQGEGETCGVAVECAMDTVLAVDLLPGMGPAWPRLEDDTHLMVVGSARPLEDAFRIAHAELVAWVAELTGLSLLDAYQLVSQAALTPIANVVDTDYSVVAKIRKDLLGSAAVMGGAHERLKSLGARA